MEKTPPNIHPIHIYEEEERLVERLNTLLDQADSQKKSKDIRTIMCLLYPPTRAYLLGVYEGIKDSIAYVEQTEADGAFPDQDQAQEVPKSKSQNSFSQHLKAILKLNLHANADLRAMTKIFKKIEFEIVPKEDITRERQCVIDFLGMPIASKLPIPDVDVITPEKMHTFELKTLCANDVVIFAISENASKTKIENAIDKARRDLKRSKAARNVANSQTKYFQQNNYKYFFCSETPIFDHTNIQLLKLYSEGKSVKEIADSHNSRSEEKSTLSSESIKERLQELKKFVNPNDVKSFWAQLRKPGKPPKDYLKKLAEAQAHDIDAAKKLIFSHNFNSLNLAKYFKL